MKLAWVKTPQIVKKIFSNYHWDIPNSDNSVYLTFDDGPIPEVTPWVLSELEKYNAKATFFCIGENIKKNPDIFRQLLESKHAIGNHTFNHLNGWNTSVRSYLENIQKCQQIIAEHLVSNKDNPQLFRPPYGKIRPRQSRYLRKKGYQIIMWDVLSADYDITLTKEKCLENVIKNVQSGSIIVFHDSIKAFPRLKYVLPRVLEQLQEKGFNFKTLS